MYSRIYEEIMLVRGCIKSEAILIFESEYGGDFNVYFSTSLKVKKEIQRNKEILENKNMGRRKRNRGKANNNQNKQHKVNKSRTILVVGGAKTYANWLLNFTHVETVEEADLVMFTGGEDVNPALYGEVPGFATSYNPDRDVREMEVFHEAVRLKKKMIGICRGGQLLTVLAGGKLIQHVENHAGTNHEIVCKWEKDKFDISMSSSHHQMFYPFNLPKSDYRLLAYSKNKLSNKYLNGQNEEIPISKAFCEPEIVLYPKIHALAIQGHPEWMTTDYKALNKLRSLVDTFMQIVKFKEEVEHVES